MELKRSALDKLGIFWFLSVMSEAKSGAEIGVYKGDNASAMLEAMPHLKLYLVDPWRSLPESEYKDLANKSDEAFDLMYQMVKALVKPYPNVEILRMRSLEALSYVPDESLDFVYIDANHDYEYVKADIVGWDKKVKHGGLVIGHDYDVWHTGVLHACSEITDTDRDTIYCGSDSIWYYKKK